MARGWLLVLSALALVACKPGGREQGSGLVPPADAPAAPTEPAAAPPSDPAAAPVVARLSPAEMMTGPLDLAGTEPFWGLKIRRDSLVLEEAGKTQVLAVNPGPRIEGGAAAWDSVSIASGGALRVRVAPGRCSDGMSERAYELTAVVEYEDRILKGCATPPGEAPRAGARTASAPASPSPPRTPGGASPPRG